MKKAVLIIVLFSINTLFSQCWQTISGGGYDSPNYNLAIKNDSTLWAWGSNWNGELGDGTFISKTQPTQIGTDTNWLKVAAGNNLSLALKSNHTLWSWGVNISNVPIQIGQDTDWQQVSCGMNINFAIKSNGTLWSWGGNSLIPIQIGTDSNWKIVNTNMGLHHAIKTNGTLWGWGNNFYGGIGDGTTISKTNPVQIGTDTNWDTITNGEQSGFAIKTNGTLWAWGWNYYGDLGDGTTLIKLTPIQIGAANNWQKISSKYHHTLGIKSDGTLWLWGIFGNQTPTQLGTESDWQQIAAGANTGTKIVALKSNSTLWDFSQNPNPPTQVTCAPLAITNFERNVNFLFYPNPTKSNITIEILNGTSIDNKVITIINPIGQIVFTTALNQEKTIISLEKYAKGIYFIEIINKNNEIIEVKKILLE